MLLVCLYLGIVAWGLPCFTMVLYKKIKDISWFLFGSFTCCCISVALAVYDIKSFVDKEDWSGVMDTYPTLVLAIGVLTSVTVLLNLAALLVHKRKR